MQHSSYGNDPDAEYRRTARLEFNRLKRTPEFKAWRLRQFETQHHCCAWCLFYINKRDQQRMHVDHAMPIYHGGSNDYSNLVLAHAKCNMKKWITIASTPQWIVNIQRREELKTLRRQQAQIMHEAEYDIRMARWMRTWI